MSKIDVFVIINEKEENKNNFLEKLFSGKIFNVQHVQEITSNECELLKIKQYLEKSCPDRGVLIIRNDSTSNISPQKLEDFMNYVHQLDKKYDLFYLCRWQDECQKMIDITYNKFFNISIGRTYSPHGNQAVYFSKHGKDLFLGKITMKNGKRLLINENFYDEIKNGNIICYCTVNNIFDYDISQATNNFDYDKTSICKKMKEDVEKSSSNNLGFLWFILVIIIAVLIGFAIVKIGR